MLGMASTLEQLDKALAAHSMWKHRLRDLVENGVGDIDAKTAMRDDACEMGKWLRSYQPNLGEQLLYNTVCARHTQFHESVGKVVLLANMKQTEDAKREMGLNSSYMKASAALTADIMAWKKKLG
jgi:methyl-accepting chemotaxis protein